MADVFRSSIAVLNVYAGLGTILHDTRVDLRRRRISTRNHSGHGDAGRGALGILASLSL